MEKCSRKVNSYAVGRSVYLMGLFDWKLVNEEKHEKGPSVLYFERDEDVPYYQEMVEIEKELSPKLLPFWLLIVPVALAFLVITTYLILFLTNKEAFGEMMYFYIFFIPTVVLMLSSTLLFWIRSRQLMKYLNNEEEVVKKMETRMKELKEKYTAK